VTTVTRGLIYAATSSAITDGANDAVRWSLTGANSPKTTVSPTGVVHVSGTETSASITLKATTTWLNPENVREDGKTATLVLTVAGATLPAWPEVGSVEMITVQGVEIPAFDPATLTYAAPVPKPIKAEEIRIYANNSVSSTVKVNAAGTIATVTVDPGVGDPVVYTITAA